MGSIQCVMQNPDGCLLTWDQKTNLTAFYFYLFKTDKVALCRSKGKYTTSTLKNVIG